MKTDEIRQAFLEFFRSKGHEVVPSDSLVPKDDPTLLFTGAGMNQFKEKFLGRNITYKRAATSQKCLRTGDLENVGRTSGHHTFFEMLGNFSFGDYFKKDAISWSWEFLTSTLKIDKGRLWASVYKDDDEAYEIWKDLIRIPENRIIRFGEKENFWPSEAPTKVPNGPCGPCSEIFYDYGPGVGCRKPGCTPACDCGRFIEVWNLVFTQFDRQPDGVLKPLPAKNIDTGMGLERLASVMQGVKTNFEIYIFVPIVKAIEGHSAERLAHSGKDKPRIYAIADHIRAVAFCVADGVMPSNEERGYVVRKLIRRAIAHGRELEIKGLFLYKLVAPVADVMRKPYPELMSKRDDIAQVVKREEELFQFVIDNQLPKVEKAFIEMRGKSDADAIAGAAFNFYDTYGMPYDMLEEIAEKQGLAIDETRFENLLERQREMSRSKTKIKSEIFSETLGNKVKALGLVTEFAGYEKMSIDAKVLAVLDGGEVILDRTPFYGQSGGQIGDRGVVETKSGVMEVSDAKKIGDTIVHIGIMKKGRIIKGEAARAAIDEDARRKIMANHTATHLLQAALRKVLGDHVHQTGSHVDIDRLRFDFTHMKKLDPREVQRVEETVNDYIKKGAVVKKEVRKIDEARREGAIALFGEKYGDTVRVISIGDFSKELCGGTHVDNTKSIGIFRITGENSIASGVRRIEAVTGEAAYKWASEQEDAALAKKKAEEKVQTDKKAAREKLNEKLAEIDSVIARAKAVNGARLIRETMGGCGIEVLRQLSDRIKAKEQNSVIILASKEEGKVTFIVAIGAVLAQKGALKAGDIAKSLAGLLGGSGGGRSDFAQGGGRDPSKLEKALEEVYGIVKEKLS